jgi:hypothetical protein
LRKGVGGHLMKNRGYAQNPSMSAMAWLQQCCQFDLSMSGLLLIMQEPKSSDDPI